MAGSPVAGRYCCMFHPERDLIIGENKETAVLLATSGSCVSWMTSRNRQLRSSPGPCLHGVVCSRGLSFNNGCTLYMLACIWLCLDPRSGHIPGDILVGKAISCRLSPVSQSFLYNSKHQARRGNAREWGDGGWGWGWGGCVKFPTM